MNDKDWHVATKRGKEPGAMLRSLADHSDATDGAGLMFESMSDQRKFALLCYLNPGLLEFFKNKLPA